MNKIGRMALMSAVAAAMIAAPAMAAFQPFNGTRQNVNFINPPGTGRCAPLNTVDITPTGPSSSGTSNFGNFVLTHSHCIPGAPNMDNPVQPLTEGEWLWDFEAGDTLFGSYSGQAVWDAGVVTGMEDLLVLGGTGRFLGATGLILSRGRLGFGMVDGRPAGIFNGTLEGAIDAPAIPEPATWGMMILGFGAVGLAVRRRRFAVACCAGLTE